MCWGFAGLDTCATDAVAVAAGAAAAGIATHYDSSRGPEIPRVKRKRLSDTGTRMSMDWRYARGNALDHAFLV